MVLNSVNALIVEPDSTRARRLADLLEGIEDIDIHCLVVHSLAIARKRLAENSIGIVLTGLEMIDARGLDSLVAMNPDRNRIPVIAIVEGSEPDVVLDAVRSLSDDCLFWCDLEEEMVRHSVYYALERKAMLQQIRSRPIEESNGEFQIVLDKIRDAIFVVGRQDGVLLYSNFRAKEWFGANVGEALEDVLEYGLLESDEVEMEITTRYPSVPRVTLRSETVNWSGSDACLISLREISKQKRAEDAFLVSQRKLELIQSGAGCWIWNATTKELFLSESISGSLGYCVEIGSHTARPLESLVHPDDKEKAESFFGRLKGRLSRDEEVDFRIRCADDLFVSIVVRGGTELIGIALGHFVGAAFRTDEKREAYLNAEVFDSSEQVPSEETEANNSESLKPGRIALIVDDEEVLRKALQTILGSYGYETVLAEDGLEGIREYERNADRIEVVILDVNMPRVDGGKVFERIRSDGNFIPIIMTSGNDDRQALPFKDGDKENCDFLLKPFGLDEVKRVLDRFFEKTDRLNRSGKSPSNGL